MPGEADNPHSRRRRSFVLRATAATLATALAFAAVVPPLASAREAESEGEGSAPPGTVLPGLEEGFEPGGEETGLGEVTIGSGEGEAEEAQPGEAEVPHPAEAGEVSPTVEPEPSQATTEPAPQVVETPTPPTTGPVYEAEGSGPTYETAPPPPAAEAVRNEAIVAPQVPEGSGRPTRSAWKKAKASPPAVEEAPGPEPVEPSEESPAAPQPAVATTVADRPPGSLSGRREHVVAPGECLWSIAEAALPPGASDPRIAAEVDRLWRLNAARIGTGDPSLIYAGTVLRLR